MKYPKYGFDTTCGKQNRVWMRCFPESSSGNCTEMKEDARKIYSTRFPSCNLRNLAFPSRKKRNKNLIIKICEGGRRFSTGIYLQQIGKSHEILLCRLGRAFVPLIISLPENLYVLNPIFFLSATFPARQEERDKVRVHAEYTKMETISALWDLSCKLSC